MMELDLGGLHLRAERLGAPVRLHLFQLGELAVDLAENMIDQYRLVLCPVVLASGRPLFRDNAGSIRTKLLNARTLDRGAISLIYTLREGAA